MALKACAVTERGESGNDRREEFGVQGLDGRPRWNDPELEGYFLLLGRVAPLARAGLILEHPARLLGSRGGAFRDL